jgi:protein SCO1/2
MLLFAATGCSRPHEYRGTTFEPAMPAGPLVGTNWDGAPFDLAALEGRPALVFFGYTNCPDVCPTTLAEMKKLYAALGERAQDVAVVFVTVDPERDSVARLGEYIPAFDKRFYGIALTSDALAAAKASYGVIAEKRPYEGGESSAGYAVDHTARTYLIAPDGRLLASYPFGSTSEEMLADVRHLLATTTRP